MNNIEVTTKLVSLKMNPFSFIRMSGWFNYLIYGFVVPVLLLAVGFGLLHGNATLLLMVIAGVMALASLVRRGMDAGQTPLTVFLIWGLSSWVIGFLMDMTGLSFKILFIAETMLPGLIILYTINNVYLIYLLFAPQKELVVKKTSKTSMIVMGSLVLLLVVAIALPKNI